MIQANELRIGNLVEKSIKSGQGRTLICKIGCEDIVRVFENIGSFNYNPIPLTEEWLLKAGFEIRESLSYKEYFIGTNEITHDWLFSLTWLKNPERIDAINAPFYNNGRHTVQYVHQLQNLYFALTGKELEFKL